jgi:hypothetical protein
MYKRMPDGSTGQQGIYPIELLFDLASFWLGHIRDRRTTRAITAADPMLVDAAEGSSATSEWGSQVLRWLTGESYRLPRFRRRHTSNTRIDRLISQIELGSGIGLARVNPVTAAKPVGPTSVPVLPEGTRLTGDVVLAKKARHFHRAGQLRFNFQSVQLSDDVIALRSTQASWTPMKTQANLQAAEGSGRRGS